MPLMRVMLVALEARADGSMLLGGTWSSDAVPARLLVH